MSHLEHHALEDSLVADLAGVVAAQVEEGDGGAIGIPVRQDGELPLTQLRLKRPAIVVKEGEALAKSEINRVRETILMFLSHPPHNFMLLIQHQSPIHVKFSCHEELDSR